MGVVDPEAVELLRAVRSQVTVALLSNGTTRLRRDLHVLGIDAEFDQIFNTAEIGVAKPATEVFEIVCDGLGVAATATAFVDDLHENVEGARRAGLHGARARRRRDDDAFPGRPRARPRRRLSSERRGSPERGPSPVPRRRDGHRVGHLDPHAEQGGTQGLAEVVGPQRARATASERVVHDELERPHVRDLEALHPAADEVPKWAATRSAVTSEQMAS